MNIEYKYMEKTNQWREHIAKYVNGVSVAYFIFELGYDGWTEDTQNPIMYQRNTQRPSPKPKYLRCVYN
jgi:hypothetical protein